MGSPPNHPGSAGHGGTPPGSRLGVSSGGNRLYDSFYHGRSATANRPLSARRCQTDPAPESPEAPRLRLIRPCASPGPLEGPLPGARQLLGQTGARPPAEETRGQARVERGPCQLAGTAGASSGSGLKPVTLLSAAYSSSTLVSTAVLMFNRAPTASARSAVATNASTTSPT